MAAAVVCYRETTPTPNGATESSKVEKFKWDVVDKPGTFAWIPKAKINIDASYQRKEISRQRVLSICRSWSWAACGALLVGKRPDGTLWAFDGQHRKLAADQRSDITDLPCLVFDFVEKRHEAEAFLAANTVRGPMRAIEKFNAMVMAGNDAALSVQEMVQASGYHISTGGDWTVGCVGCLMKVITEDAAIAKDSWQLCVEICQPKSVTNEILAGVFCLEKHMRRHKAGSLTDSHNKEALCRQSIDTLSRSIQEAKAYHGGGPKAFADGIAKLLNRGRRTRRISSPYGDGGEE